MSAGPLEPSDAPRRSFAELTERLGSSARKARALVALERKTWQAPALGEAYRAGDVSWVRALTLSPIVTEDTAASWIGRAREVTVRRLSDEVERDRTDWYWIGGVETHPAHGATPG